MKHGNRALPSITPVMLGQAPNFATGANIEELHQDLDLTGRVERTDSAAFEIGGFSDIYRGVYTDESGRRRRVAIKVLRNIHTDRNLLEATRRRLNRESRLWHWLGNHHPNILPFFGIARGLGPSPALISPFCGAGHVLKYISQHPEANRLNIVRGTASALAFLHSHNIIHGDLKGHNVLIDDGGNARLSDFGRAKIIDHRGFTTVFSGSARYMAPELLLGPQLLDLTQAENDLSNFEQMNFEQVLTKKTDIYAFAIVALEIFTGRKAWYYLNAESVIVTQVQEGRRPRRERYQCQPLTNGRWALIEACWIVQPDTRPEMATVVHALASL